MTAIGLFPLALCMGDPEDTILLKFVVNDVHGVLVLLYSCPVCLYVATTLLRCCCHLPKISLQETDFLAIAS